MPSVFLSPSTQEYNNYYDQSGSEEFYMNLIADKIQPYLDVAGVTYGRNDRTKRAGQAARDSNQNDYALHFSIHSNAAAPQNAGKQQGVDVYYYRDSPRGKRAAEIIAKNLEEIYPFDAPVRTLPNTSFVELNSTRAPAILIEVGYHDNPEDAEWIKNNLDAIARNLADSIVEIVSLPTMSSKVKVKTDGSQLNVRKTPSPNGDIVFRVNNGDTLDIVSREGEWLMVERDGKKGYVIGKYVSE